MFCLSCVNFKTLIKTPVDKYQAECWIHESGVLGHVWVLKYRCGSCRTQILFKVIG